MLHFTSDWQYDLSNKLVIPSFIAVNQLRLHVVLYSLCTKTVIILEPNCPCEENMETAITKNTKNTILCPWQLFPMAGQCICFLLRFLLGATALQM